MSFRNFAPPALSLPDARLLHCLAYVFDAAQHGGDGDEVTTKLFWDIH